MSAASWESRIGRYVGCIDSTGDGSANLNLEVRGKQELGMSRHLRVDGQVLAVAEPL